jgi:hypothetical protein
MQVFLKMLTLLLLVSLAALPPAEHGFAASGNSPRPAGCHHPHHAPRPTDFRCCQTGHRAAIVPLRISLSRPAVVGVLPPSASLRRARPANFVDLFAVGNSDVSPPGIVALRV